MMVMTDAEIIESLGGATAVAKRLGFKTPDGARRVHNWIKRGIPPMVRLEHAAVFKKAMRSVSEPNQPQAPAHQAQAAINAVAV